MKKACYVPIIVLTFYLLPFIAFADAVSDDVEKIQKAYENIESIRGLFVQKNYIKDLDMTMSHTGKFYIKRPSKMKWSYKEQELVINSGEVLVYEKLKKQAYKSRFDKQSFGQAPISLLNGFADISTEFAVSGKSGGLILKPKTMMSGITRIEIQTTDGPFPIKSFKIFDTYLNKIEITLKDIELNSDIEDTVFSLEIPKGVGVYEHNP